MSDISSSFIPKRNTTSNRRQPRRKNNFFLLAIISYALFVAAPIASAAVFVYQIYVEKENSQAVLNLKNDVETFSVANMERVTDFNDRLQVAKSLVGTHVSLVTLLNILESQTANTVQFKDLEISRTDKNTLTVSGDMTTNEFDAALFQREIYSRGNEIAKTDFSKIVFAGATPTKETTNQSAKTESVVKNKLITYKASLVFSADKVLYTPQLISTDTNANNTSTENPTSAVDTNTNMNADLDSTTINEIDLNETDI